MHFSPSDHAAGDLPAGAACGLTGKIIPFPMDHRSPPDDIPDPEPVCAHSQIRAAAAQHQRRQIAGMPGMRGAERVIVSPGIRKALTPAAPACVDMQCEKASLCIPWQPPHHGFHQNAVLPLIKPHFPRQPGHIRPTGQIRHRIRCSPAVFHSITRYSLLPCVRRSCSWLRCAYWYFS